MPTPQVIDIHSELFGDLKVHHRCCPLCSTDNASVAKLSYSLDIWHIVRCGCGFVYIDKAPIYEELKENMAWENTFDIEVARRQQTRPISYKLSRLTRWRLRILPRKNFPNLLLQYAKGGDILDIGCGNGDKMGELAADYRPHGVEVSAKLAELAKAVFAERGGDCICAPSLSGLQSFADEKFSAVTLRSYLEHESQPLLVLKEVYRVLQSGHGVCIIKVPNYGCVNRMVFGKKWCGFRYPDHQNYFTPKTLRQMAKAAGFRHFQTHWTFALPTSDNMYLVLQK